MKAIIFLLCFVAFFVSCSSGDGESGKNYSVPRFAVYPPSSSGLPGQGSFASFKPESSGGLKYLVWAPVNVLFPLARAQENGCDAELAFSNEAPQTFGQAASISGEDIVHRFYAQAIFYDCVTREQALQSGVGETVQNDSENEDEEVTVLTARRIGDDPEVLTEFVSWTDLPESDNVRGRLVNKYVQENGIITKTRVDLEMEDGARKVESMLHFVDPGNSNIKLYSKGGFQESNPDAQGNFQDQEVWGRFYDTSDNMIVQVRAKSRVNVGVTIELKRCPISGSNIGTDCSGATAETEHYDATGTKVNDPLEGISLGSNTGNGFYAPQSEEEFFTPEFSVE